MKRITIEVTDEQAAALLRLCDKFTHAQALVYLYPHLPLSLRNEQAYTMVGASAKVAEALCDAGVSSWPWIEVGSVGDAAAQDWQDIAADDAGVAAAGEI